jgi:hypothetical protein
MAFGRALLAAVLCTGLGVAVCPGPVPQHAHQATLIAPASASISAIDLCLCKDAPDLVVPDAVVAPSRHESAPVDVAIAPARDAVRSGRVLDIAPKTSPPV